tara:strand:- start:1484 stop:3682 length:2199 start_codon:yes stop_codon:yes gene_type:complete
MPQAIIAIGVWVLGAVGATGLAAAAGTAAFLVGAAVVIGAGVLAATALTPRIGGVRQPDNDKSRQSTIRSTIEPQKIIYGEALVSGPITFVGVSGTNNEIMHHVIALAGHEVDAITDIWLDDQIITNAQFNGSGEVTSGTFTGIMTVTKWLGTADQTYDSNLVSNWTGYTVEHRGRGIAYIHTQFVLTDDSQDVWDKYSPNNIKALVRGRRIYDPRLDILPGGAATNPGSIVFSSNPALAIADYLTNTRFGMKIPADKIDWLTVTDSANACDVLVDIPGGLQEKRFTANGVLFATDSHRASIDKLLSAMNGKLIYSSGFYYIKAGIYEAPSESLNEEDLSGPVSVKTSVERSDRFNTVGGIFIDPSQLHKSSEFPKVTIASALARDNNEVLEKEIDLPFTNSSYMAQRISNKLIQLSDQQKMVIFPANLAGLRVAVGDRVSVSIEELNWSSKVFECLGWSFNDGGNNGVMLTLREDDVDSYADMAAVDYSTVLANGALDNGFAVVPKPTNVVARGSRKTLPGIDITWDKPFQTKLFEGVEIWANTSSSPVGFYKIATGPFDSFTHDSSHATDPLAAGDQRWYWLRNYGGGAFSSFFIPIATATATDNISDASVTSSKLDNDAVIFAPSGLFVIWNWDGTNKSPNVTTQDVPVVFTNLTGAVVGGTTTIQFTFVNSTTVTVAESGTNANTVVTTYEGGTSGDGYAVAKIVHTASGVAAYVQGSIYATGGSGGK